MALAFGKRAESPWEELRGGLVLGGDRLWKRARAGIERAKRPEEARWSQRQAMKEVQILVRELVKSEADDRVKIWARIRLGGERGVDVAREYGYRDGAGVAHVVRRLEHRALMDRRLARKLAGLKRRASVGNPN